jgi:hypothetical protein
LNNFDRRGKLPRDKDGLAQRFIRGLTLLLQYYYRSGFRSEIGRAVNRALIEHHDTSGIPHLLQDALEDRTFFIARHQQHSFPGPGWAVRVKARGINIYSRFSPGLEDSSKKGLDEGWHEIIVKPAHEK